MDSFLEEIKRCVNRSHTFRLLTPFVGSRLCGRLGILVLVRRAKPTLSQASLASSIAHGRSVTALAGLCPCVSISCWSQFLFSLRGPKWE